MISVHIHILAILLVVSGLRLRMVVADSEFDEHSFSLSTKYLLNFGKWTDQRGLMIVNMREYYSPDQKRAVIVFETNQSYFTKKSTVRGRLYLDRATGSSVLLDQVRDECRPMDVSEFREFLLLQKLIDTSSINSDDVIIGPFSLIREVNKRQAEFTLKRHVVVNNLAAIAYDLKYTLPGDVKESTLSLFYSLDNNFELNQNSVPIKIKFYDHELTYFGGMDFSKLWHQKDDQHPEDIQTTFSGEVVTDVFTTKLIRGNCSAALADKAKPIFLDNSMKSSKFSFRIERESEFDNLRSTTYVAYDARVGVMRLDYAERDMEVKKLINFKANRIYHTATKTERPGRDFGSWDMSEHVLDPELLLSPCVVAKLSPDRDSNLPSLGKLIAGANKFVYMGKGRARGMDATIYESSSSELPLWLDQPIAYESKSGDVRGAGRGIGSKSWVNYQTLLFVANDQAGMIPLLIHIYKFEGIYSDRATMTKQVFNIYDFAWQLNGLSMLDERVDELFSLEGICSSGYQQHGRVEMLLKSDGMIKDEQSKSLDIDSTRNLELVTNLQSKLDLPATMIYDLESRLIKKDRSKSQSILASFRVADHTQELAQLKFLSRGVTTGKEMATYSFTECYLHAAHRIGGISSKMTFFYHEERQSCLFGDEEEFMPFESGKFEMFEVSKIRDTSKLEGLNWLRRMSHGQNFEKYLDQKFVFFNAESVTKSIFSIQKIEIKPTSYNDYVSISAHDEQDIVITKISGFAIDETDSRSSVVTAKSLDANTWKADQILTSSSIMSFDRCRSICLKDFTCHSFSVCTIASGSQCVLSEAEIDFDEFEKTVNAKTAKVIKEGVKINVTSENDLGSITVIKHSNCEVHNKIYLDIFKLPRRTSEEIQYRQVVAVQSPEECAERCFAKTLETLKADVASNIMNLPSILNGDLRYYEKPYKEQIQSHRLAAAKICKEFSYFDNFAVMEWPEEDKEELNKGYVYEKLKREDAQGYCMFPRVGNADGETNSTPKRVDLYEFKFTSLFEVKYGVRLLKWSLDSQSSIALLMAREGQASAEQMSSIRSHVERGDNFQVYYPADNADECARVCFGQLWGPWPACRSFEFSIVRSKNITRSGCHLNSITLRQAIESERFDLIAESKKQNMYWHYEPRDDYIADKLVEDSETQLTEDFLAVNLDGPIHIRIRFFGLVIILMAGTVTGAFVGIKVGRWSFGWVDTTADDETNLVRRPTIEFQNQVNSDMTIQE